MAQLSGRDLAVLEIVGRHRFMTSGQVEGFYFHDHATAASAARTGRRVLARLERLRLLERAARRIGGFGAGSAASVWMLTSTGQRLLNLRDGRGTVGRVRLPGERFIAHHLAVAEAHLQLVAASRRGDLELLQVQLEPDSWRRAQHTAGQPLVLKPDLYALTAPSADSPYDDQWYLEIDRATESLPTVIRQCRAYQTYRATGIDQQQRGVFPIVVWLVPDANRADKLAAAMRTATALDTALFRITTLDGLLTLLRTGGEQ